MDFKCLLNDLNDLGLLIKEVINGTECNVKIVFISSSLHIYFILFLYCHTIKYFLNKVILCYLIFPDQMDETKVGFLMAI